MQDIMEEKVAMVFTIMKHKIVFIAIVSAFIWNSCGQNNVNPANIPNVPVNITINLDLPQYQNLSFIGNYVYENGGNNGIVIIHYTDGNYYAIDRTCSHDPLNSCNNIEVNEELTRLKCGTTVSTVFRECCGSQFFMTGQVINGPAIYPLKNYRVTKSGNYLNISN